MMDIAAMNFPLARRAWWCLILLGSLTSARASLVLNNYSAANPIKIMAIGDSITDDCSVNGAWRQYLQPLLETNGYPFTFVGRNQSTPSGSFTKVQHEGYCGAVVAPPGVLTYSVHGYAGPEVYLQTIVPDAFTNGTIPDLVLVFIGVNDIGRGRNPYQVATNDMPTLLNLIFSNAPNANVILPKITTLSLNTSGLDYASNFVNVATYNDALQAMVNQRRALGQNVSLADMFSAVGVSPTMFMADGLHPNALGLQAIAQEWLTRIQAITVNTNLTTYTLIHGGDAWKYSDTGVDLGTSWSQPGYDDSGWASGPTRLGYNDPAVLTTISYGTNSANKNITTYFRHKFVVPPNAVFTSLNFRLSAVSGAVVWLNGQEAFRSTNMPSGLITYTNLAMSTPGVTMLSLFNSTNLTAVNLPVGTNLVAVELHLQSASQPRIGFDLELLGTGYPAPPVSIGSSGSNVVLSWPATNGSSFSLYSSTNLATTGSWTPTTIAAQTNGGQIIVTQTPDASAKFFLLQRP
jgi:lysophospholipase L1-like esterase